MAARGIESPPGPVAAPAHPYRRRTQGADRGASAPALTGRRMPRPLSHSQRQPRNRKIPYRPSRSEGFSTETRARFRPTSTPVARRPAEPGRLRRNSPAQPRQRHPVARRAQSQGSPNGDGPATERDDAHDHTQPPPTPDMGSCTVRPDRGDLILTVAIDATAVPLPADTLAPPQRAGRHTTGGHTQADRRVPAGTHIPGDALRGLAGAVLPGRAHTSQRRKINTVQRRIPDALQRISGSPHGTSRTPPEFQRLSRNPRCPSMDLQRQPPPLSRRAWTPAGSTADG